MDELLVRPAVADLRLMLFQRLLHPELLSIVAHTSLASGEISVRIRLIPSGHAMQWIFQDVRLEEVLAETQMEMPSFGRLFCLDLDAERSRTVESLPGCRYHWCVQRERLPPEQFYHLHEELIQDSLRRHVLFHYQPQHRLHLAPLSVVAVQPVRQGLSLTAFHTFPDEWTVVKSQSLLEQVGEGQAWRSK